MTAMTRLVFKRATEPDEFSQIHRLNYRTFVEEIPQHQANTDGLLVDKFDGENVYHICRDGDSVVGMIAVRGRRPFSLDQKLPDLDRYLPAGCTPCELRLLAVEPAYRNGAVFRGLIALVARYCLREGFDAALISGTVRQLRLYRHLGFTPFGPLVGSEGALYQPMVITLESLASLEVPIGERHASRAPVEGRAVAEVTSFLPGPVDVHPDVLAAFTARPLSHRGEAFDTLLRQTRRFLCTLVNGRHAVMAVGSGTLANDMVAAQLRARGGRGLVLVSGEFGERLVDHARRAGLSFEVARLPWGASFDAERTWTEVERHHGIRWAWMVHLETSTGVLNDLDGFVSACRSRDVDACVDGISAVGNVPVDLSGVALATAVSSKGLGSFPGLAIVLHDGDVRPVVDASRYLDLAAWATESGVPFTHSSNLVAALRVAVERKLLGPSLRELRDHSAMLRAGLRDLGLTLVAPEGCAAPAVVTVAMSRDGGALALGEALAERGYALSYRSDYLRVRNWIQVALMGEAPRERTVRLLREMRRCLRDLPCVVRSVTGT